MGEQEQGSKTLHGYFLSVWGFVAPVEIIVSRDGPTHEVISTLVAAGGPFTLVVGELAGEAVDIWLDDEGLLKPAAQINYLATDLVGNVQQLVGNALILRTDSQGAAKSLSYGQRAYMRENFIESGEGGDVADVIRNAGVWYPTAEQRLEMVGTSACPPLHVPPPVVIGFDWDDDGNVVLDNVTTGETIVIDQRTGRATTIESDPLA